MESIPEEVQPSLSLQIFKDEIQHRKLNRTYVNFARHKFGMFVILVCQYFT